jgi:hypothetical protein
MRAIASFLFCLICLVYLSDGRAEGPAGDSISSRYLPFSILGSGSLYLEPVKELAIEGLSTPYWAIKTKNDGKWASLFPVVTPLLLTPAYIPAVAFLNWRGWTKERLEAIALIMERLSAAALSAGAAFFLFLALVRRGATVGNALLLTLAFAFATGTWSTSSRILWLHPLAEFLVSIVLFLLSGRASKTATLLAGVVVGLIACNRTPDAVLALGLVAALLIWGRRSWWLIAIGGAIPCALTLSYNLYLFHHPAGAWGMTGIASSPGYSLLHGIAGMLFSPTRGLFVFTPFLLFVPFGVYATFKSGKDWPITVCLAAGIVGHVLVYATTDWRAGFSYGPRYMVDTLPVLIFLLAPALPAMGRLTKTAMIAMICFSVTVEYIGVFHRTTIADQKIFARDVNWVPYWPLAWDVRNTPFVVEAHNPRQWPTLLNYFEKL